MSTITLRSTLHIPEACRGNTRTKWRALTLRHRVVAAPVLGAEVIPAFIPVWLAHPRRAQVQKPTSVAAH